MIIGNLVLSGAILSIIG